MPRRVRPSRVVIYALLITFAAVLVGFVDIDPPARAIRPVATVRTLPSPRSAASLDGSVWYATPTGVQRVNPANNKIVATVSTPSDCCPSITAGAGSAWVGSFDGSVVRRIDPATNTVAATITAGSDPAGVAATDTATWVTNHSDGTVSRIDPATNTVVATIKIGPAGSSGPGSVAIAFGDVWVGIPNASSLVRIDPALNRVKARVHLPSGTSPCGAIIRAKAALWVGGCGDAPTVAQIDPVRNKVVTVVAVGGASGDAVVEAGKAWYAANAELICPCHPRLVRLEPGRRTPTAVRTLPRGVLDAAGLLRAFGSLWLTDPTGNTLRRFPGSALR